MLHFTFENRRINVHIEDLEMQRQKQLKTQSTIDAYKRINEGNLRHAALMRERGDLGDLTDRNMNLAMAVADLEPRVQPSTARQYRAAAMHAIESEPGPYDGDALQILQPEMTEVQTEHQHMLTLRRTELLTNLRGSQQRAEHLSERDWQIFLAALNASKNPWGRITALWFACTLITGLRPCEWEHAKMKERTLVVSNAKATNGRAHGPTRTLDFGKAGLNTVRLLETFLQIVAEHQGDAFADLYNGARNLITKVARSELTPRKRYPTLYTARHSFSSKAKSEFTKQQVAALMGHASSETAPRHYAVARYARGGCPLEVEPSHQDVRAVRNLEDAKAKIPSH
jgi:hypothetical protein